MTRQLPFSSLIFLLALSSCNPAPQQLAATAPSPVPSISSQPTPALARGTVSTPAQAPSARGYHQMAYDSESDRVILFSGEASPHSGFIGGTWAYDPKGNSWEQMTPEVSPDPAAAADALTYDSESDRVILFVDSYFYGLGKDPEQTAASETWAYDFNTDTWTKMSPDSSPYGLVGAEIAYDAESDRAILFGGATLDNFNPTNATWAYDFNSDAWTMMTPAQSPLGEYFHAMTYNTVDDRVILLKIYPNELWEYDYNANTWLKVQPPTMPAARYYSSLVYDKTSNRAYLFGGAADPSEKPLGDLWAYDFSINAWEQLAPANPPGPRGWHAAAFIPKPRAILVFGGGPDRDSFTAETWLYSLESNAWTQMMPSS